MTADEIWRHLPGTRESSVHLAEFLATPDTWVDDALDEQWEHLARIRRTVNEALEAARAAKTIGAPLTAHVTVTASGDDLRRLRAVEADLPMIFIVSQVTLAEGDGPVSVAVAHASGDKCPRCWRFVGDLTTAEGVCGRCADAVGVPA